jgi:uncharacterized protein YfaP (DUF2135 family)
MWGGATGDVQITLTWSNPSSVDVDLHVWDPQGNHIYYQAKTSPSGGQLDVDNKCTNYVNGKPENIVWPKNAAPSGSYIVKVALYSNCGNSINSQPFLVRIVTKGGTSKTYNGVVTTGDNDKHPKLVTTFTLP